jgi:DNA polymerase III delta prime subunit
MPNTATFMAELRATAAAGEAAIVAGNTDDIFVAPELAEPLRLLQLIAVVHAWEGRAAVAYSAGKGARQITPPGQQAATVALPAATTAPGDAVPAIFEAAMEHPSPVVVIVDHAETVVPPLLAGAGITDQQATILETILDVAVNPRFDGGGHAFVLVARGGEVHPSVERASGFRMVRAPLPDHDTVELGFRLVGERARSHPERFASLADGVSPESAAGEARGLRIDDLLRASRQAAAAGGDVERDDLRRRKAASIQRHAGGTLRLHPEGRTLEDVAGMSHVRDYIARHLRGNAWPPSLLLAGPPGVGKTFVARAIGSALGRRVVSFHQVRSKWVGETEANTARALAVIDELAPIVVVFDEVDQALGQRSTGPSSDGGTSERFQATLLEFTGEGAARPDVLFVLLTNRPDLLDRAQLSRVETIPILHPTPREIAELLPALASQLGHRLDPGVDLAAIGQRPELRMTSARHLLRILGRAAILADCAEGARAIAESHLLEAIDDYLPDTDPVDEELMGLTALSQTSFRSLLPWTADEDRGMPREVPHYVEALIDENGELDDDRLRARMRELSDQLAFRRAQRIW